jgi:hypothetical protein|nr:MAG TPA: hypothetical protein [Caudoviricetes sp.]
MIYSKTSYYEDLENIKIINYTTKELVATITITKGIINIDTEEPYRMCNKYKNKKEEIEVGKNETK